MTFERYRTRILRVQLYIEEHLDGDLKLETLAKLADTSSYHFHRIFKGMTGETLAQYVRRVRLEQSSIQLKYSERPIVDIALGAGYQTHEAFSRAFHRRFGVSPSEFRAGKHPIDQIQETRIMPNQDYEIKVVETQSFFVASMRHVGPYQEVGPTFQKFCAWAGQNGLFGPQSKLLGLCHDDPNVTEASKIRYDCCITVDDSFEASGEITKQSIAGGRYAVLTHKGCYSKLSESYDWLYGVWLKDSGEEVRDVPPYEVYLNDASQTPPDKLLTEIHLPLN